MHESENDGIGSESGGNPFAIAGVPIVDPAEEIGAVEGNGTAEGIGAVEGNGAAGTAEGIGEPRKRRGRKPGSKNAAKASASKADLAGLESILFSIHLALSAVAKTPELALDQAEAHELAKAAAAVQSFYSTVIDPKIMAWGQLIIVAGSIYAPRLIAVSVRIKKEKAAKRNNVVKGDFPNHAPAG